MDWTFLVFFGGIWVIGTGLIILNAYRNPRPSPPARGLTKEEEELDAITGEMWRQMGE
jgi:hypothetical protein